MDVIFGIDTLVNTEWTRGTVRTNVEGTRIVMGTQNGRNDLIYPLVLEDDRHWRFTVLSHKTEEEIIEEYPIVIKGSRIMLGGIHV